MLLNKKEECLNKLKLNEEEKLNWKYIDLKIKNYRYHCLTPFGCTKLEFAENNNEPPWLLHTCLIELYKTFHTNVHGCRLIIPLHYRSEWPRLFVYTVSRLHLKFKANRPSYCMTAHTLCRKIRMYVGRLAEYHYDIPLPFGSRERRHVNVTSNPQ